MKFQVNRIVKHLLLILVFLSLAIVVRFPSLHQPINRDISAYATIGLQIQNGALPYRDYFDHKQPLIYLVFWLIGIIAGSSNLAIQITAALVSGFCAILLYFFLSSFADPIRSFVGTLFFIAISATRFVEGTDLNTEHLLVLVSCAAILIPLLFQENSSNRLPFFCGIVGGLSILAKVVGVFILPAALVPLVCTSKKRSQTLVSTIFSYSAGVALPVTLLIVIYAFAGAFPDLYFSNITFNFTYVQGTKFNFDNLIWIEKALLPFLLTAFTISCIRLWLLRGKDMITWSLLLWLIGSLVGAKLGGRNFPHYFAPVIPPVILLSFLPLPFSSLPLRRYVNGFVIAALLVVFTPIIGEIKETFRYAPDQLAYRLFGEQAFPWVMQDEVGAWLRAKAQPDDTLFVAGSEPGFYWSSGIRPSTRFIYDSPIYQSEEMHMELVRLLMANPPKFLVIPANEYPGYIPPLLESVVYKEIKSFESIHIYRLKK